MTRLCNHQAKSGGRPVILLFSVCALAFITIESATSEPRNTTAEGLVTLNDIDTISLSPDGTRIAYQLRQAIPNENRYEIGWYVLSLSTLQSTYVGAGGEPQLLEFSNGLTMGSIMAQPALWLPDGHSIAYLRKEDGEVQMWRAEADGGGEARLTNMEADIRHISLGEDESKIYIVAWKQSRQEQQRALEVEGRRGYLLDGRFNPGASLKPIYRSTNWLERSGERAVRASRSENSRELWVYDIASDRTRRARRKEQQAYARASEMSGRRFNLQRHADSLSLTNPALIAASANGREAVAWLDIADPKDKAVYPDFETFASEKATGTKVVTCTHTACVGQITGLWWDEAKGAIYFERRKAPLHPTRAFYAWFPATDDLKHILTTDDVIDQCALSRSHLICLYESLKTPRTIVSLNMADGSIATVFDPNPEFKNLRFGDTKKIDLTNEFGERSFAHILTPPDFRSSIKYPLVITTYRSRGFLRGAVGDEYPPHLFAANGFIVLSFDIPESYAYRPRGAPEGPEEQWLTYKSVQASLDLAFEKLKSRNYIDFNRVAITGLSAGASTVFYALVHSKYDFTAAIASYAVADPLLFYVGPIAWQLHLAKRTGGLPLHGGKPYFEFASPAINWERITAPILLNIADRELVMSMQTIATLMYKQKPIETYVFPNEYHVKWQPQHRLVIYRRNLQWLKFWLMGQEADDPVGPDQYTRWREMRGVQCARLNGDDTPWYCENDEVNVATQ